MAEERDANRRNKLPVVLLAERPALGANLARGYSEGYGKPSQLSHPPTCQDKLTGTLLAEPPTPGANLVRGYPGEKGDVLGRRPTHLLRP